MKHQIQELSMKAKSNRQIATWLYYGAIGIYIQIILGGITRLTGSGLSITEWKPLLGALPPMNTAEWQTSFDQYKEIAQFKLVNAHFSLADYQSIFFWEWLHRNWARFLGFLFIIPFIKFLIKKQISKKLLGKLIVLFLLGLLQALIGWIMVKSGLNDTSIAVSDIRLAIHFITAVILLCYTVWMATGLSDRYYVRPPYIPGLLLLTGITLSLLMIQLFAGALMAGSKAALAAPTWPDINGHFIPPALYKSGSNTADTYLLAVQFAHRSLAYLLCLLVLILFKKSSLWKRKTHRRLYLIRLIPLLLICLQTALGILTLLNSNLRGYRYYAIVHQGTGLLLLISLLLFFYACHKMRKEQFI